MKNSTDIVSEQETFRLASGFIAAILVIIGLVLTLAHTHLIHEKIIASEGIGAALVGHMATAFLIAGFWHAIELFSLRKDFLKLVSKALDDATNPLNRSMRDIESKLHNISDQIHASRHERSLGFIRSYVESHPELYEEFITKSREFTVVLNNGYVWISTHRDDLKERFKDQTKLIRFIILSADSEISKIMEKKENLADGAYDARIQDALALLSTLIGDTNNVDVYSIAFPVGQAIFLSETGVLTVPHFVVEPTLPPVFVFERNEHKRSYYKKIYEDVEHLLKHKDTRLIKGGTNKKYDICA